ncbi:MAG: SDR family oxidoreductase [Anaerolineae bacterium]
MALLQGKIALVTGAASGIGRATALSFAREGASVIVSDMNAEGGSETVRLIMAAGGQAFFHAADVSKADQVEALIHAAITHYGRLDCAFNNAGIGGELSPLHEKTEEEWDRVLSVNLKGVWLCMKYEIPAMLAAGGGAIVNMASVAGLNGFRMGAAYSASKHGVIGLTKTAALELARKNIRVNAVSPYFTDTPMVQKMVDAAPIMKEATVSGSPMRRLGDVEETAAAVVWLCSDQASYITGHALPIDGGYTAG